MELILSICMLTSASVCREEKVPLGADVPVTAATCLVEAPFLIASWSETHPKWKVVRWRCGAPGASSRDI